MATGTEATRWWQELRPGVAARRGPLIVVAAATALWLGHLAAARLGVQLGPWTSGWLTLAAMAAAGCYAVRRRFLILSLYMLRPFVVVQPLRRFRALAVWLDQLRNWRVAHLAIGILSGLPLWWHIESAPRGVIEIALLVGVAAVLGSGLLGVALQYMMPHALLQIVEREVRVRDAEEKRRALFVQAEERIPGRSEALVQAYLEAVKPILQGETSRLRLFEATLRGLDPGALVRGRGGLELLEQLDEKDAKTFRDFLDLAERKVWVDLNLFQLELSTGWLTLHAAAVVCAATLAALHVCSVFYFGGV